MPSPTNRHVDFLSSTVGFLSVTVVHRGPKSLKARSNSWSPQHRRREHSGTLARQHSRELLQYLLEIGLLFEHRQNGIRPQLLNPLERGPDRKRLRIERIVHLVPDERHRNRRARERAHAERRNDGLTVPVLQVIEIDLVATLR